MPYGPATVWTRCRMDPMPYACDRGTTHVVRDLYWIGLSEQYKYKYSYIQMELDRCPSPATVASHLNSLVRQQSTEHVCSYNKCNIENLTVCIYCDGSGKYAICCKYLKPPPWVTPELKPVKTIYNIYLCKNTGKIHYCHSGCDGGRITNADNCQVCLISGVQYESETVRSWHISSRCVATVIQDKRDPHMFSRGEDGRVKSTGVHNIRVTQCIMICKEFINRLLFSKIRMDSEKHKYIELCKESQKTVNKYRRFCERNTQPKCYLTSLTLYIHQMKRKPMFTHLIQKTKEEQKRIVSEYTKHIISYWKMFVAKTNSQNSTFSFKIFVPACLYMMRNGLFMAGIYIIEKSRYLESALPEANGLHLYSINKPTLTNGQKHITRAIREAVESKRTTPQALKEYCQSEYDKITI